ncbi:MAG: hypothetical protein GY765_27045 [bacterium]|nr:hypothetical protein [bacterium]
MNEFAMLINTLAGLITLAILIYKVAGYFKRKRKESFPVYLYENPFEEGAVCLQMILRYYGKAYSKEFLLKESKTSREGVSMLGVSIAAEVVGMKTMGVRITYNQLRDEAILPCIIHWKGSEFIVLYHIRQKSGGDIVFISDPSHGLVTYSKEEFCSGWCSTIQAGEPQGLAILMETTEEFYKKHPE